MENRIRDAEVEARAVAISKNVRCLECGHQSIEESGANIAVHLRKVQPSSRAGNIPFKINQFFS